MANKIRLDELLGRPAALGGIIKAHTALEESVSPGDFFADETGFHIYGEIRLDLQLTAADDTKNAERYLSILQDYASIAHTCAAAVGASLLEVQGKRVHLLMPSREITEESVRRVLAFCFAFANTVYSRLAPRAGDAWRSFVMATDHGRAIILATGDGAARSIISLGPPANAPAKQLPKLDAHKLAIPSAIAIIVGINDSSAWSKIDLLKPPYSAVQLVDKSLSDLMESATESLLQESRATPIIKTLSEEYVRGTNIATVSDPLKCRGICRRADLDGFTKQVSFAFDRGESAIQALVSRFYGIVHHVNKHLASSPQKLIAMPWAGDCAFQILLIDPTENYETVREYLPAVAGAEWHEVIDEGIFGKAKWAVGMAAGDADEGSNGYVLVARVATPARDFLVAAGWGVGRSLDAQEADNVSAEDTVVTDCDFKALGLMYQKVFDKLDSRFWVSRGLTKSTLQKASIELPNKSVNVYVPQVTRPVPPSKPHWHT